MFKPFCFGIIISIFTPQLSAQIVEQKNIIQGFDPSFERFELPGGALGNSV